MIKYLKQIIFPKHAQGEDIINKQPTFTTTIPVGYINREIKTETCGSIEPIKLDLSKPIS